MALTLIDVIWFWPDHRYGVWQCGKLMGNRGLVLAWALAVSQMAVVL
jgi:hypothetical protein